MQPETTNDQRETARASHPIHLSHPGPRPCHCHSSLLNARCILSELVPAMQTKKERKREFVRIEVTAAASVCPFSPYIWSVVLHGASFSLAQEKAHELSGGSPSGPVDDPCEAAEYAVHTLDFLSFSVLDAAGLILTLNPAVCLYLQRVLVGRRDCRRPQLRDDRVSSTGYDRRRTMVEKKTMRFVNLNIRSAAALPLTLCCARSLTRLLEKKKHA